MSRRGGLNEAAFGVKNDRPDAGIRKLADDAMNGRESLHDGVSVRVTRQTIRLRRTPPVSSPPSNAARFDRPSARPGGDCPPTDT
jgi:hypothetical protein